MLLYAFISNYFHLMLAMLKQFDRMHLLTNETEQNKMKALTKERAIEIGGNEWAKDSIERVYLDVAAVNNLRTEEGFKGDLSLNKKTKAAKTFLDCVTGELKSDNGTIRVALNSIGFGCAK